MSENEALGTKLKSIKTKEERCRFAREEAHPLFKTVISEVKLYRNCPKYAEVAERILENIEEAVSEKVAVDDPACR